MTLVLVSSPVYGDLMAVARKISSDKLEIEMSYYPPTGTQVTVHITGEGTPVCTMSARATSRLVRVDRKANRTVVFSVEEWS